MSDRPVVSQLAEELYAKLGPFTDLDEATGWHLLKYVDVVASSLANTYDIIRDRDDLPGWSVLFDPDQAPSNALPYLSQFVGAILTADMSDADRRNEIKSPGQWRRGTPAAMRAAIRRTLSGGQNVWISERFAGEPYHLWVRTLDTETPDQAATHAAIISQKPLGILLDYDVVSGWSWSDVVSEFTDWDDAAAGADTWAEFVLIPPP